MKRSLLASTALCAVFVTGANAAPPAPIFNWAGFYIGGNVGGLWSTDSVEVLSPDYYTFDPGRTNTLSPSGIVGGVQAGYNYQISSFVFGVEGDLDFTSAKGSFNYPGFFGEEVANHSTSFPFFADLRARAGVAFDRFLPYVTGGVVFANLNNSLTDPSFPFSVNRGSSATGWTLGAGVEYAIDNHWSVKGEYLYMQFPDVTASVLLFDEETYSFKFRDSAQLARVGVNYRF